MISSLKLIFHISYISRAYSRTLSTLRDPTALYWMFILFIQRNCIFFLCVGRRMNQQSLQSHFVIIIMKKKKHFFLVSYYIKWLLLLGHTVFFCAGRRMNQQSLQSHFVPHYATLPHCIECSFYSEREISYILHV